MCMQDETEKAHKFAIRWVDDIWLRYGERVLRHVSERKLCDVVAVVKGCPVLRVRVMTRC